MGIEERTVHSGRDWLSHTLGTLNAKPTKKGSPLAVWLVLLVGGLLGIAAAFLIQQQNWILLFALLFAVPALALFYAYPFIAVLIWLLIFPFFIKEVLPDARLVYWLVHRAIIPGGLAGVVILHLTGWRRFKPIRLGIVDWVMLTFLMLGFVNIIFLSDQPAAKLIRFYDRFFVPFCIYWLIRFLKPDTKDFQRLAPVAFIMIFTQGTIGMLSWFAPGVLPSEWLGRLGERTVGTFGNPAVYTTTLVFYALLLMEFYHETKSALLRWASLLAIGFAFFCVFFSFSRGSWLGALVVLGGLFFLYPRIIGKLVLVGTVAAAFLFLTTPFISFLNFAGERLTTQTTAEGRIIEGAATLRMINEKPLFGWGYDNHEQFDNQFKDRVLGLATQVDQSSHNTYLLMTAEMGLVGLAIYLLPAVIWLVRGIRAGSRLPKAGFAGWSFLVMLWLLLADHFIAGNFTDLIKSNFFSTGMWWLILGLIANITERAVERIPQLGK